MEPWTAVVIALLAVSCVAGPFICARAVQRRQAARPHDLEPREIRRARKKLRSLTVAGLPKSSTVQRKDQDVEMADRGVEIRECSICIGPVIPEPVCLGTTSPQDSKLGRVFSSVHKTSAQEDESRDGEILTLRTCNHVFHASCLSSWFMIERYDCPVCRLPYYVRHQGRSRFLPRIVNDVISARPQDQNGNETRAAESTQRLDS